MRASVVVDTAQATVAAARTATAGRTAVLGLAVPLGTEVGKLGTEAGPGSV